jgi:hypothetical protein
MSGVDKAKKVLDAVGTGLHALDAIGKLAKGTLATGPINNHRAFADKAFDVLTTISGIADAVNGALHGTVSVEELEKEIAKLPRDLAMNDDAVAGQIDAKFPK